MTLGVGWSQNVGLEDFAKGISLSQTRLVTSFRMRFNELDFIDNDKSIHLYILHMSLRGTDFWSTFLIGTWSCPFFPRVN